jgi:DNA polymerase II large subunit
MSMELAEKYSLSDYLKSRLKLLEKDVKSLTTNDLQKQVSLSDFM